MVVDSKLKVCLANAPPHRGGGANTFQTSQENTAFGD